MARIWKRPYAECKDEKLSLFVPLDETRKPQEWVYFVQACSFTFTFISMGQIAEYLEYYSHKIKPSSRAPEYGGHWPALIWAGDHWERQSRFARLPLYLREEPKRQKVVKALERALKQFGNGKARKPTRLDTTFQFRIHPNAQEDKFT